MQFERGRVGMGIVLQILGQSDANPIRPNSAARRCRAIAILPQTRSAPAPTSLQFHRRPAPIPFLSVSNPTAILSQSQPKSLPTPFQFHPAARYLLFAFTLTRARGDLESGNIAHLYARYDAPLPVDCALGSYV